ncbi:hypothetical protein V1477_008597 [Vespula maculifrons]|uniref:Uncharacterized protein n=1 Tax=Vespula maculifrons TaxID=7453 RepID=A0ABD2CDH1_VESMC
MNTIDMGFLFRIFRLSAFANFLEISLCSRADTQRKGGMWKLRDMARTIRPIEAFAIIGFLSVAQSEKNGVPIKSRRFDIEYFVNLNDY